MAMAEAGGKLSGFGGSIKVDNVQALVASAAEDSNIFTDHILQRYLRPEMEYDPVAHSDDDEIPIIDLQRLADPNFTQEEAAKLKFACEEWGFFQLVNHGISEELIERAKSDLQGFFRLPLEVKEAYSQKPGDMEGYGQAFVVSEDQKLDWGDMFFLYSQPESYKSMQFWPTHPLSFRETFDRYSLEVREVAHRLLGFIGKNLGLESDRLVNIFKEFQSLRINYYPPCPYTEKVFGLAPHSDAAGLTLLLQVNQVQGLQIRRHGKWIPVKPLPGAFVANIGDVLEILTNGKYKSIEHRAVVDPKKERLSIAAFHIPSLGELVGPLPELVEGCTEQYKTTPMDEFIRLVFSRKLDGKSLIDRLKLNP